MNKLKWNPQRKAFDYAKNMGGNYLKKYLRNSSSAYIKKEKVREYVFNLFGEKCVNCGSHDDLQIDHIKSVYSATLDDIYFINSVKNLQILCRKCNSAKNP